MSQEMNILCCYSCEMFQVHIVKKMKKWQCKICNAKQSIRRVYFQGSGKDCRSHVQKLNSQKEKGFEPVQVAYSNTAGTSNVLYDIKEMSYDQRMSSNSSTESEVLFNDAMRVCNEEYTCDEQIIGNNHERLKSNTSNNSIDESDSSDRASTNVEKLRFVSSKSTSYINNNTGTESADNDTKENHNIFESYEDFDVDLDF